LLKLVAVLEFDVIQNNEATAVALEQAEVVIGRRNENREVHLDLSPDDLVSRVHARVWLEGNAVVVEDLGSRGGTLVDGAVITGPTELQPTANVTLGNTDLRVRRTLPQRKSKAGKGRKKPRKKPAAASLSVNAPEVRLEPKATASAASGTVFHLEKAVEGIIEQLAIPGEEFIVGRKHPETEIGLDLTGDLLVSRTHARVWHTRGICWVEDLNSTHGTRVNGAPINGALVIQPTDQVQIGSVVLRITVQTAEDTGPEVPLTEGHKPEKEDVFPELDSYPVYKEDSYSYHATGNRSSAELEAAYQSRKSPMGRIRGTHHRKLDQPIAQADVAESVQKILPDLPRSLDNLGDATAVAQWLVDQLPEWMDGVKRASIFLIQEKGEGGRRLHVLAHVPALKPILSDILAHRAWHHRTGCAWKQVDKKESMRRLSMHAGLYVPLICMGEELGILCVENTEEESEFSPEQLAGVMAVAQLAAVHLQHRLARETGNKSAP